MPKYYVHMYVEKKPERLSWLVEADNPDNACVKSEKQYREFLSPDEVTKIKEILFSGCTCVLTDEDDQK